MIYNKTYCELAKKKILFSWDMSIVRKTVDSILNLQDCKIELLQMKGTFRAPEQDYHGVSDFYLISSYQQKENKEPPQLKRIQFSLAEYSITANNTMAGCVE